MITMIIIYHDFLSPSRRGIHVKSDYAHTIIHHTPLTLYTYYAPVPRFSVVMAHKLHLCAQFKINDNNNIIMIIILVIL